METCALKLARRVQHFCHTADGTGSGVESDFDEVSSGKLVLQLQQSAGDRNGLYVCAPPLSAFGHYCGRDRSKELNSGGTLIDIGLGEVSHSQLNYATLRPFGADYQSTCTRAYA